MRDGRVVHDSGIDDSGIDDPAPAGSPDQKGTA
jgi:hypothetical protein